MGDLEQLYVDAVATMGQSTSPATSQSMADWLNWI
jgi:hypothetical protein